jgi:SAM-dependent methyltransferase
VTIGSATTRIIDFPACVASEFPAEFPLAWDAVRSTLEAVRESDLAPLARHSPALRGYDWSAYLRCSVVRMTRVLRALTSRVTPGARVLDCGSYFGNFSLMLAAAGYDVDAADSYPRFAPAFDRVVERLTSAGVNVHDLDRGVESLPARAYDAVLAMGVIEHLPHTPRPFLTSLTTRLARGGWLILDTPNLGYLYTRQRLERGESIFCPLPAQWGTEIPFEGHHREYTPSEVQWMLDQIGHDERHLELFNYSYLALPALAGDDLLNHERMEADPTLREVIFSASRRAVPA